VRVLVDGRVGGADGIGRYTRSLAAGLTAASAPDVEPIILRPGAASLYSRSAGDELLDRARREGADLLHLLDFRVPIDARPSLPTLVTVHDVMRIDRPELCYSDAEFHRRRGPAELDTLRFAVAALRDVSAVPRGCQPTGTHHEFLVRMLALAVRHAACVVTPTHAVADRVRTLLPAGAGKLRVTRWGVDHLPQSGGALPAGIPNRFVLYVGQARAHKGTAALIDGFFRTAAARGDVALVLVGRDMTDASSVVRDAATTLGPDRVVALGQVPDEQLAGLYARAAVLVHLADHEGFGFTPLEAMRQGCAVVATDIAVLRETLGDQAVLVDPRDRAAIARSIDEAVSTDQSSARDARRRWAGRFRWDRHVLDLLAYYREVTG
jgi:glycosyltransferase involved in cell wall biosynthesis